MADGSFSDQACGSTFTVKDGKIYGTVKAGKGAVVCNSQVKCLDFPPELTLSVPSSEFITDMLDITVSIRGVGHATCKLDDGEEKPIANGDVIKGRSDSTVFKPSKEKTGASCNSAEGEL